MRLGRGLIDFEPSVPLRVSLELLYVRLDGVRVSSVRLYEVGLG